MPQEPTIYSLKITISAREGYSKNNTEVSYSPKSILVWTQLWNIRQHQDKIILKKVSFIDFKLIWLDTKIQQILLANFSLLKHSSLQTGI